MIYVEVKEVSGITDYAHLYLTYGGQVIRGGPTDGIAGDPIAIQAGIPLSESLDARNGQTPEFRGQSSIPVIEEAEAVWNNNTSIWTTMVNMANSIGEARLPYVLFSQNSNSVINTVLYACGFTLPTPLPQQPGDNLTYIAHTTILNFDYDFSGSTGNDFMRGYHGNDTLDGEGGDDVIKGGSGDDTLTGGDGADRLVGGAGDDTLAGDKDNTTSQYNQDGQTDILQGGDGHDSYYVSRIGGGTFFADGL